MPRVIAHLARLQGRGSPNGYEILARLALLVDSDAVKAELVRFGESMLHRNQETPMSAEDRTRLVERLEELRLASRREPVRDVPESVH